MKKIFFLLLILLVSACQSSHPKYSSPQSSASTKDLTRYALSLQGTPYKYGGSTPDSGFDCSGFVSHVFKHTWGETLPRSSEQMSKIGVPKNVNELKAGDLVFYNTLHKSNSHVGIYLGDWKFIHAPSSGKFVSIVDMDDAYWRTRYNGARRIRP